MEEDRRFTNRQLFGTVLLQGHTQVEKTTANNTPRVSAKPILNQPSLTKAAKRRGNKKRWYAFRDPSRNQLAIIANKSLVHLTNPKTLLLKKVFALRLLKSNIELQHIAVAQQQAEQEVHDEDPGF
jgi:hypothetical protein